MIQSCCELENPWAAGCAGGKVEEPSRRLVVTGDGRGGVDGDGAGEGEVDFHT